jgi:hypothetical protein
MSLTLIVQEDGSLEAQELQYLKVKQGSIIEVTMGFYKDKFKVYPWNLANAVTLNFEMKALKEQVNPHNAKTKTSPAWDLTDAADGILRLILDATDIAAVITGDTIVFAGQAGDKIKVTIDDIVYDNIDISACVSIANVVTAINTAVGAVVASVVAGIGGGQLRSTSTNAGTGSNVTIADGTTTTQTVIADLFAAAIKSNVGMYGPTSVVGSYYCEIDFTIVASTMLYKTVDIILDIVENV